MSTRTWLESPLQPVLGQPLQRIRWAEPLVAEPDPDPSVSVLSLMFAHLNAPSRPPASTRHSVP
jgi:hypothetical protein